jgi:hypothetical protein
MLYSKSETTWLDRRAERIAEERRWPLPIARSEAEAELGRLRSKPTAIVLKLASLRITTATADAHS